MGRLRRVDLILASSSPRRKAILRAAGYRFRIDPSQVDENINEINPRRLVKKLALLKARTVAKRYPTCKVLGADTIVVCAGQILGKPKDLLDAKRMLDLQSGRWQRVYTGVAVVFGQRNYVDVAMTKVLARRLDPIQLIRLAGKHMDKAGAYAVQDKDDPLIKRYVGDRDNVVGLPMRVVKRLLSKAEKAV